MTRIEISNSYNNSLYVDVDTNCYRFRNDTYGMICNVYKSDVDRYMDHPYRQGWGCRSASNSVREDDTRAIIKFIREYNKKKRYKTITDVLKSRSKYKEKYLAEFTLSELMEYKNKEDANGKVKSSG